MLKIERDNTIHFHYRERLLTRTFLQALVLALGFHAIAFFLFDIRPTKIKQSKRIFLPVEVDAQSQPSDRHQVLAQTEKETHLSRHFFSPSAPEIPEIPKMESPIEKRDVSQIPINLDLFHQIEKMDYHLEKKRQIPKNTKWQLQVHGPLAEKQLLKTGIENLNIPENAIFKYTVQVENKTGKVIWYMPHEKEDIFAETIFKEMRFASSSGFVTSGEIELTETTR